MLTMYSSTLYDDIIFLKVGPLQTKFAIHRGLVSTLSAVFRESLQPKFKDQTDDMVFEREGETTVIILPKVEPEIFVRVNTWFYSSKLLTAGEDLRNLTWDHLIGVYLFSVRKQIARLHNECIDTTISKTAEGGSFPNQDTVNALYKVDIQAPQLRKLLIKLFAVRCDLKHTILSNRAYHPTFMNWVVIELYELQREGVKAKNVDMWEMREDYYAYGHDNPIAVE